MDRIHEMIHEYLEILDLERDLAHRKANLRSQLMDDLVSRNVQHVRTDLGTAQRKVRYTLKPRTEEVLGLLNSEDMLPFSRFTPARVRAILVPKYGRERLIPLFEITKSEYLQVGKAGGAGSLGRI